MLYDIFARKRRKEKEKIKPTIIADIHEKDSMILAELKESNEINLEIKSLKIGDYLIGPIIIERKTISDFISSMINKRLVQQLNQMQAYKQSLLILEGDLDLSEKRNLNNSIRGFILSINLNYNIPIIFTKDYEDTTKYLILLAKQQTKPKTKISLHARIPKTTKERKQYILESFPNIGPKKAERLLEKFKTLQNVFTASEFELKEILKNQAKNFKDLLED